MVKITEKDIANYERDGVVKIKGAMTASQIEELDRSITPYLARRKLKNKLMFGDSHFFTRPNVWKTDPYFLQLVQQPMFINLAARLLKSNRINLLMDMLFVKSASCKKEFGWHQEHSYTPTQGDMLISFWMATENVSLDDGGLQFIKGSHRWTEKFRLPPKLIPVSKFLPQYWGKSKTEVFSGRTCEESDLYSKDDVVSFDVEPGDILAFPGNTLHRSGPNWADNIDRKGYVIRYTGDDVTYRPHSDTGISFQLWDAELNMGEKMRGPLYPLVYKNGKCLELESVGLEKGRFWRLLQKQILSLRGKSAGRKK
jgi:ectoine hydroxylase-related dioxygenase (phytanoyl-CoA dioxygenase family)